LKRGRNNVAELVWALSGAFFYCLPSSSFGALCKSKLIKGSFECCRYCII
jgi:hypothetical protein